MSVQGCHYVMVAAKFDYQAFKQAIFLEGGEEDGWELIYDYEDNAYREDVHSHNDLTIVIDGMGGQYVFFGIVFAKGLDGLEMVDCDEASSYRPEVERTIREEFQEELDIDLPIDVRVYAFTHWH